MKLYNFYNLFTVQVISDKSDWVLQPDCIDDYWACDSTGMQNHTRTCSIDPGNNEEPLNEEVQSCTLPACSWKDHYNKEMFANQNLKIATLPQRTDTSSHAFRHFISSIYIF